MPTLTAPIADSPAGNKLSSIGSVFSSAMKENLTSKPVEETSKVEPETKPVEEVKSEPAKVEPARDDKPKVEEKPAAKADDNKQGEKKKAKISELPEEVRDLVLASQQRQIDKFNEKNARIKELEDELNPTKTELAELRNLKETAPKDLERLNAEVARLQAENAEYDGKVKAYDVTNSREYKQGVKEPWDKNIVGEVDDKGMAKGGLNLLAAQLVGQGHKTFDATAAYNAINVGDEAALEAILNTLPTERARIKLSAIFDEGQKLIGKHRELTTDAGEKLKAIQDRQTQAEKDASERVKGEVGRIGAQLSEQVANRFPFLRGVEKDDDFNAALAKAKETMNSFDVVSASPQERAEAAHARAFANLIATRLEIDNRKLHDQLTAKDEEHSKVEQELRQQIAGLEERLGNLNGETVVAQPGNRDGNGRFAQKPTIAGVWKAGMKGVA